VWEIPYPYLRKEFIIDYVSFLFISSYKTENTSFRKYKDQSWREIICVSRPECLLAISNFKQIEFCVQIALKIPNMKFHVFRVFGAFLMYTDSRIGTTKLNSHFSHANAHNKNHSFWEYKIHFSCFLYILLLPWLHNKAVFREDQAVRLHVCCSSVGQGHG
jgi:hypothetical protein